MRVGPGRRHLGKGRAKAKSKSLITCPRKATSGSAAATGRQGEGMRSFLLRAPCPCQLGAEGLEGEPG